MRAGIRAEDRAGRRKRDAIRPGSSTPALAGDDTPGVLVVLNKVEASGALLEAVRQRAAEGAARYTVLVPNPAHLPFDRNDPDTTDGDALLARALPQIQGQTGGVAVGRVAVSPNAYDDVVEELQAGSYAEVIVETPPSHLSHRLHVDLPQRIAELGYPLKTVATTA